MGGEPLNPLEGCPFLPALPTSVLGHHLFRGRYADVVEVKGVADPRRPPLKNIGNGGLTNARSAYEEYRAPRGPNPRFVHDA